MATDDSQRRDADASARPHGAGEALVLLGVSLLLFGATLLLEAPRGTLLGDVLPALRVLAWIGPAYFVAHRRGVDPFRVHGLLGRPEHLGRAALVSGVILGSFVVGFVAWQAHAGGTARHVGRLALGDLGLFVAGQVLLVALPEEYFFRGVLQPALDPPGGPGRSLLGAPFGRGVVAAAALFALCHLVDVQRADRLLVFFPALWFGWVRSLTGSIAPAVVVHALANTVQHVLFVSYNGFAS